MEHPTGGSDSEASAFHVFSVKPQPPGEIAPNRSTKEYLTRKTHEKTRTGCARCKTKRVKCDEKRPACARCTRNRTECIFASSETENFDSTRPQDTIISKNTATASLAPLSRPMMNSSADLHLFKHYDTITSNNLLIGPETESYHNAVLRMAQSHTYLFHAMLSIAALHLTESNVQGFEHKKFHHLALALRHFQDAISTPIVKENSDAILLTSVMMNVQYFSSVTTSNPQDSFIHSSDSSRLSWLSVQEGAAALVAKTRPYHQDTQVLQYFFVKPTVGEDIRRLPKTIFGLCDVTDEMGFPGTHSNPYHDPLHALSLLLPLEPTIDNFIKYLHFGGRIYRPFVRLIEKNDHRALLLLSYWFALLGSVDMWWCRQRVRRDCLAICMMLDEQGGNTIRTLLEFPASVCGYPLGNWTTTLSDHTAEGTPWPETGDSRMVNQDTIDPLEFLFFVTPD